MIIWQTELKFHIFCCENMLYTSARVVKTAAVTCVPVVMQQGDSTTLPTTVWSQELTKEMNWSLATVLDVLLTILAATRWTISVLLQAILSAQLVARTRTRANSSPTSEETNQNHEDTIFTNLILITKLSSLFHKGSEVRTRSHLWKNNDSKFLPSKFKKKYFFGWKQVVIVFFF